MNKTFYSITFLLLTFTVLAQAQTTKEEFLSDIRHSGGIYQQYIYVKTPSTPAPEGYKPFYISHYGRHGSRWLTSSETYTSPCGILGEAYKAGKLTSFGESIYKRVNLAADNAEKRYGDLSPLGAIEHREIAERMFYSFPEVFSTENGRECYIYSRSTTVPRCILSMAASNERLKELNPEIRTTREATEKNNYLNNYYRIANRDSVNIVAMGFLQKRFDTKRFISSVFSDTLYANDHVTAPLSFINDLYAIAADLQDIPELNISMFDIFSKDELFALWQTSNIKRYFYFINKEAKDSSKLLLKNIIDCADEAIEKGNISADLRYGHDSYISPLITLMNINNVDIKESDLEKIHTIWSDFKVSPMGANLQLIFYRNDKTGDVIVKVLHNETEAEIPVDSDILPYYHWKDVKAYYEKKIDGLTL